MYNHKPREVSLFQMKSPCENCANDGKCNIICPVRAKWWDTCMARLRKVLGYEKLPG